VVIALRRLGRRGASRYGCLIGALAVVAVLYYGVEVGAVYLRYWQMLDEMRSVARLASNLDDASIQRRLSAKADALELPRQANRFIIRRTSRPRQISISTSWTETVKLPLTTYTLRLSPVARAPL
jgi:hypothetical protein